MYRQQAPVRKGRGLLVAEVRRPGRQEGVYWPADLLRIGTYHPTAHAEYRVAFLEGRDVPAYGLDVSGEHHTEDGPARRVPARQQPQQEPIPAGRPQTTDDAVAHRHGRREDPNADLVPARCGSLDLREAKHLRWAVPRADDRSHAVRSQHECARS